LAVEALVHQAQHDPLTGLANRSLFLDRVRQALERSSGRASVCAICFDIDRFKVINDSLGYTFGDQLLLLTAIRLARLVRPGDTIARVGEQAMAARVPMRRLGRLDDLDGPFLLLASDAGRYLTGVVLPVDGGHLVASL
jgi:diguanylate cyclase (GGDEF)-like protein